MTSMINTNGEQRVAVSRVSNHWVTGGLVAVALFEAVRERRLRVWNPLVIATAALAVGTVRVVANSDGLQVGFGPWGWPGRRIGMDRIEDVRVEDLNPLRYGGWGYRIRGHDTRVVVQSGPAVIVDLRGGGSFGVTVPDAEAFAAVLLAAHSPSLV